MYLSFDMAELTASNVILTLRSMDWLSHSYTNLSGSEIMFPSSSINSFLSRCGSVVASERSSSFKMLLASKLAVGILRNLWASYSFFMQGGFLLINNHIVLDCLFITIWQHGVISKELQFNKRADYRWQLAQNKDKNKKSKAVSKFQLYFLYKIQITI